MMMKTTLGHASLRIAIGVVGLLAIPAVAMQLTDEVDWTAADFVAAGILLAIIGSTLELAFRRAGSIVLAIPVAALGLAAMAFGNADDAPGLILLGILLVAGAAALAVRRSRGRSAASVGGQ